MSAGLGSILDNFGSNRSRVRLLTGVLSVLDGDAVIASRGGVPGLCTTPPSMPSTDGVAEAALSIAEVVSHLDGGEPYAGVATPARTALALYDAHVDWSPGIQDLEDEHGRDAVMRLVGLGLIAEALSDTGSDESADAWLVTESGRAALAWFVAVEIVLSFATEEEPIDGDKLIDLLDAFFDAAIDEWAQFASDTALARARIIVNNWTDVLCPAVTAAGPHVARIAGAVRAALGEGGDVEALMAEAKSIALYPALVARHVGEMLGGELTVSTTTSSSVDAEEDATGPAGVDETALDEEEQDESALVEEAPREEVEPPSEDTAALALSMVTEPVEVVPASNPDAERRAQAQQEKVQATLRLAESRKAMAAAQGVVDAAEEHIANIDSALAGQADEREELQENLDTARMKRRSNHDEGTVGEVRIENTRVSSGALKSALQDAEMSLQAAAMHRDECRLEHQRVGAELTRSLTQIVDFQSKHLDGVQEQRRLTTIGIQYRQERVGLNERTLDVVAAKLDQVNAHRAQRKAFLVNVRKERRGLGRATATTSRKEGVLQEEMDALMSVVDTSRREARRARDYVSDCTESLQAAQAAHAKRMQRLQALEVRQSDADTHVNTISAEISESRTELEELLAVITVARKEHETVRQKELVRLRKKNSFLRDQLSSDRERLPLLKVATKKMRAQITAVIGKEREVLNARDEARVVLKAVQTELKNRTQTRTREAELAVAALDMLKSNAKRLEEAHATFSSAQGALDGLYKELKLADSQRESMDREIQACREQEKDAQETVKATEIGIAAIQAEIVRNGEFIGLAKQDLEQARLIRIEALRSQITERRMQIDAWCTGRGEAQEDQLGLGTAERKIDATQATLTRERHGIVHTQGLIRKEREAILKRQVTIVRMCREREASLSLVHSSITGAGFTIQGLVADRDGRQKRIAQAKDRIGHLKMAVVRARNMEDEAVEKVADFQSWVERSRAALERCSAAIEQTTRTAVRGRRETPEPPRVPGPPSKLDRLLADLKQPTNSKRTDIDTDATMVVGRAALIAQAEADAAATRVLSRSAKKMAPPPDEDATVVYSPEELRQRLLAEEEEVVDEDATMILHRPVKAPRSEDT